MNNDCANGMYESVLDLRCAPIECVRIGFVGLGVRAKRAIHRMMHIEGCRITALCDLVQENIDEAKAELNGVTLESLVVAERVARDKGCSALITGESLGQVASQTLAAIEVTDSVVNMPVFRSVAKTQFFVMVK